MRNKYPTKQGSKTRSRRTSDHLSRRTMPILITGALLATLTFSGPTQLSQSNQKTRQPPELKEAQRKLMEDISNNIRRVGKILKKAHKDDIEPGLLFSAMGRKQLRPKLAEYGEMYLKRVQSEPVAGVIMADTLTLPESVDVLDDTVIIASHIRFKGKAPTIKGRHDIHVFALDSLNTEQKEATITIDVSGRGRKEWLGSQRDAQGVVFKNRRRQIANHARAPFAGDGNIGADGNPGTPGQNANNGVNGDAGQAGSCSSVRNGGPGGAGGNAPAGGNGGNGSNANAGENASSATLTITDPNGSYSVSAKGGDGGNGGTGGSGGTGGTGGTGGRGGDGAGCSCNAAGIGDGGNGGNGGAGGKGGTGGTGGNGGNGGNGGAIVVNYPFGYDVSRVSYNIHGGTGGQVGGGGAGGFAGSAGSPGQGGHGGSVFGCDPGRDGGGGNGGNGGGGGDGGNPGTNPGQPGQPGSISWNQTGDGPSGVGDFGNYQAGGGSSQAGCTDWYYVWIHCDYINEEESFADFAKRRNAAKANHAAFWQPEGWDCHVVDTWYAGCF